MNEVITRFALDNEMDVVLAHKRAIQVGELTGMTSSDQTRFATAVSEISRNCIEHAGKGDITFTIQEQKGSLLLFANISDHGPGIPNLTEILAKRGADTTRKGNGIINSKKLVDFFDIHSSLEVTRVRLGKKIPERHPPINKIIVKGWAEYFAKEIPVSPYEEIKKRNVQLLELSDQLKIKQLEADLQLEEIKRLNSLLEKKNENLKQITYTIAHDLKNPLTNIKLCCELAEKAGSTEDKNKFIRIVDKSADMAINIISGLQNNIEYDPDIALKASYVKLKSIVDDIQEQFAPYLEKVDGKVYTNFEEVEEICYPQVYLSSILSNLLNNSIKYSADRPLEVHINAQRKGKQILLTFRDNGIGIDLQKNKDKIFKPFNRFTEVGDGKGMGLSIVHYMIAKNGGSIQVESEIGKGTVFLCYLYEYELM